MERECAIEEPRPFSKFMSSAPLSLSPLSFPRADRLAKDDEPGPAAWPGKIMTVEASIEEINSYLEALYEDDMDVKVRKGGRRTARLCMCVCVIVALSRRLCPS